LTGSSPLLDTIGIVEVASFANAMASPPPETITATRRRIRSAISAGWRSFQIVILDRHVLAFDVAGFAKSLLERGPRARSSSGRVAVYEPDHRYRLLAARRDRPRCRAPESRDELPPSHS
jgi:hypothetical protein